MSLNIAKSLVEGAVLGLNAYIKPGGVHRYTPGTLFDEVLCNLVSAIDSIVDAVEVGSKVKRGEIAASSMGYKKLLVDPLKELFRSCSAVHPQYVIPLIAGGTALGLSGVESILEESSKFKKALELVVTSGLWSDVKHFIETLRTIGRLDMYDHLRGSGYADIAILKSSTSLNEVLKALGSRWRGFLVVEVQEGLIFTYLKRLQEIYKNVRNLFHSVIALYMDIIKSQLPPQLAEKAKSAEQCGYMKTVDCARIMYEIDTALRKSKLLFSDASEVVTVVAAFGYFEGFK
ncbi:MAG: hypothetical protein LM557_00225 [Desulfurococcaceae archaeon]|jgi:hypothetical protein|nr:hypothetical protein [Desulfurococcaceae archaeon]